MSNTSSAAAGFDARNQPGSDDKSTYVTFALDEGLISDYPGPADRPKRVQVNCVTPPTPRVAELLTATDAALHAYGGAPGGPAAPLTGCPPPLSSRRGPG